MPLQMTLYCALRYSSYVCSMFKVRKGVTFAFRSLAMCPTLN